MRQTVPMDRLPRSRRNAGFTLTEMMVTVVILGVLSAVAVPSFRPDREQREARTFAQEIARDLQRARSQAVSDRNNIRAFVYADRIELRQGIPGAAAAVTDPLLRIVSPRASVRIFDVVATATAPGAQVIAGVPKILEFTSLGSMNFLGQAALSPAFIYIRSTSLKAGNTFRETRIDLTSLTGFVTMRDAWN